MCAGDTALDRYAFMEVGEELQYGVNGRGTIHKCRDFKAIFAFAEQEGWQRYRTPEK